MFISACDGTGLFGDCPTASWEGYMCIHGYQTCVYMDTRHRQDASFPPNRPFEGRSGGIHTEKKNYLFFEDGQTFEGLLFLALPGSFGSSSLLFTSVFGQHNQPASSQSQGEFHSRTGDPVSSDAADRAVTSTLGFFLPYHTSGMGCGVASGR